MPGVRDRREGSGVTFPLLVVLALAVAYVSVLLASSVLRTYRFPIPFAVPIFDTPFALVAIGVAYLCVERHRLRHDFRSVALGLSLWVTALLVLAHIFAQPDYPGTPGVNPGVAPYFFFSSYFAGLVGIGLAAHYGDRDLRLRDRLGFGLGTRFWLGIGGLVLATLFVFAVIRIRPLLPSLAMPPGRMTPFAIWMAGVTNGVAGVWALWGGRKKAMAKDRDPFAGFFVLAAFVWLVGLLGFLIWPYRYSIPWYLAGLARPTGVGIIFVGLLREQVWLYREARGRLRDLEGLHSAGQALVTSLDPHQIVRTIASEALRVSGGDAAILFRLDAERQVVRAVSHAGRVSPELVVGLELPVGQGASGLAVARCRPVWLRDVRQGGDVPFPEDIRERMRGEGLRAILAIPIAIKTGELFGALSVFYRNEREFSDTDVELLAAFGTQASVGIENARSFDDLALKGRHDEALQDFCQRLLEATGEREILNDAVRVTQDLLEAEYVAVFLHDPKTDSLRLEAGRGWQPGIVGEVTVSPSAESFAGYAFRNKEPMQVEDLSSRQPFTVPPYLGNHGVRAGIVVPLGIREQPVGVVAAYYTLPHRFGDEEKRVLTSLAHQTALALEKVHFSTELQANLQRLQETQAQLIQADKLKALGTLLSGMAHELNNPLSTIQLSVQLMKRQHPLAEPVRKRMDAVEEECERASRIIRDLLVFARRKPPERRRTDLVDVVRAALALQSPEFDLNKIGVVTELTPIPMIWADAHQLQQVFLNLFTNATHAMKSARGRGVLTVRSSVRGSEVSIEVEDDGPGIPAENLGRIFDPFFTTKGTGEGTGLGLSLSIGIVEAHGGRMHAENVQGAGVRFTVRLPVGEGVEAAERPAVRERPTRRGARILVVDDEDNLRAILTDLFTSQGHHVDEVAKGQDAIASLERGDYDVVALDLKLPDIDGKTVWHWILRQRPALAPRVAFMTGDTMSADTQAFLKETGRPVLTKPLSIDKIVDVVDALLGRAASSR